MSSPRQYKSGQKVSFVLPFRTVVSQNNTTTREKNAVPRVEVPGTALISWVEGFFIPVWNESLHHYKDGMAMSFHKMCKTFSLVNVPPLSHEHHPLIRRSRSPSHAQTSYKGLGLSDQTCFVFSLLLPWFSGSVVPQTPAFTLGTENQRAHCGQWLPTGHALRSKPQQTTKNSQWTTRFLKHSNPEISRE